MEIRVQVPTALPGKSSKGKALAMRRGICFQSPKSRRISSGGCDCSHTIGEAEIGIFPGVNRPTSILYLAKERQCLQDQTG